MQCSTVCYVELDMTDACDLKMVPPGQNERWAPKGPPRQGWTSQLCPVPAISPTGTKLLFLLFDFVADHATNYRAANRASRAAAGQHRSSHAADCGASCGRLVLA
jgi:hypothetical protein